jgi:hypothetical protein
MKKEEFESLLGDLIDKARQAEGEVLRHNIHFYEKEDILEKAFNHIVSLIFPNPVTPIPGKQYMMHVSATVHDCDRKDICPMEYQRICSEMLVDYSGFKGVCLDNFAGITFTEIKES